jgi:hypothetical protein
VNEKAKGLLRELGEAVNQAVTNSPQVESILQALRDCGYEVYLMLEANIALASKPTSPAAAELERFTAEDRQFLKRLKIEI